MNENEMQSELESLGITRDAFSLSGARDEAYCLDRSTGGWSVYYSERGLEAGRQEFRDKIEAYEHLKSLLLSDPAVYRRK